MKCTSIYITTLCGFDTLCQCAFSKQKDSTALRKISTKQFHALAVDFRGLIASGIGCTPTDSEVKKFGICSANITTRSVSEITLMLGKQKAQRHAAGSDVERILYDKLSSPLFISARRMSKYKG